MAKLSLEAWTLAFFDVMKEKPPINPKTLKKAGAGLQDQQKKAEQGLQAAKDKTERARNIADDAALKLSQVRERNSGVMEGSWTKEGRESQQRDEAEAAERARKAELEWQDARAAEVELKLRAKALGQQIGEFEKRQKSGDFDGLQGDLAQVVMQAQLELRLEAVDRDAEQLDEKLRRVQEDQQEAKRNYREGAVKDLGEDIERLQKELQAIKNKRSAIEALMPGYDIAAVEPAKQGKLEEQVESLRGACTVADQNASTATQERERCADGQQLAAGKLEDAAALDPKLKPLHETLVQARSALAEKQKTLETSQDELKTLDERYRKHQALVDGYAQGSDKAPSGNEVDGSLQLLAATVQLIADAKKELRSHQDALRSAQTDTEKARQALAKAIDQRIDEPNPNPVLVKARQALVDADAALGRAKQASQFADEDAATLRNRADEAGRRLKVVKTLPEATDKAGEFNAALKGIENTPIWEGSDALLEQLGQKRYDALVQLAHTLTNQFQALVDNGATMDELRSVYKDTPELWLPPRFREEEKNWVAMRSLLDEESEDAHRKESEGRLEAVSKKIESAKSKLDKGETLFGKVKEGIEYGEKGPEVFKAIAEKLVSTKELSEKFEKVLGLAASLGSVLKAPMDMVVSGGESMETEDPVEAMMAQEEFMGQLGELMDGLTKSLKGLNGLDIGGVLVQQLASALPGIGVATNFATAMKGMVEAATRIDEAIQDAETHALALESEHRGAAAMDQFARRDKHLAARASAKTGAAMIKAAGSLVELTGVGVAVGKGMQGVATGIGVVQTVGEQIVDRNEGEKARALLDRAQAGDGHARAELFRFHPRYAKGILAIMADEGDAMALRVLSTHGLSEDMIRRSSPKIVKRYLMKKFGETDEPASWTSVREGVGEKLKSAAALIQSVDDFFGNVADKLLARFDGNQLVAAQATLSDLAYQLQTQADVAGAVGAFVEVRMRRDALADSAKEDQQQELKALDLALATEQEKVVTLREHVLASLERVRGVLAAILKQPPGEGLRDKAEAAARAVLREHLVRVNSLAGAG